MGFNFDQEVGGPLKGLMADIAVVQKDFGKRGAPWDKDSRLRMRALEDKLWDFPQMLWVTMNFSPSARADLTKATAALEKHLSKTVMHIRVYSDEERAEAYKLGRSLIKQYLATWTAIWKGFGGSAPKSFQFEGFKILNPDRLSDWTVKQLLDTIVYTRALFKKRGMEDLLLEGVKDIELVLTYPRSNAAGMYWHGAQQITLVADNILGHTTTRHDSHRWVDEVFIHEFGHYIHIDYITGDARKFWDGTWAPVDEAEKLDEAVTVLTLAQRKKFMGMILGYGGDVVTVSKRLKSKHERLMFLGWLRIARFVKDKATQVRLTPEGEAGIATMLDPEGAYEKMLRKNWKPADVEEAKADPVEWKKGWGDHLNSYLRPLFLTSNKSMDIDFRNRDYLDDLVAKIEGVVENKSGPARARVTEEWGTPSEYGKTNVREDFAESFVQFIVSPQKMTEKGLYRMKRTLWLSGFGNKPVMRLAQKQMAARMASRYLRGER